MGYYTEFKFRAKLKKDTPENILTILDRVINKGDIGHNKTIFCSSDVFIPDSDNLFFKCERWYMLFLSTNWDDNKQGSIFHKDGDYYVLDIHTEFKNYDDEIEKFILWIEPYVVGRKKKRYVGYYKGESSDYVNNIYLPYSLI